jgi:hypothetical protein
MISKNSTEFLLPPLRICMFNGWMCFLEQFIILVTIIK